MLFWIDCQNTTSAPPACAAAAPADAGDEDAPWPGDASTCAPSRPHQLGCDIGVDDKHARPGDAPLTADAAVTIGDAADIAEAQRAAREGERPRRRPLRFVNRTVEQPLAPVTDALLADPPPGDWLSWRRTRDSHGYSPLDRITRDNVDELRLAWVLAIREGRHQATPLVHEGVMFLANPGSVVQALDAATGEVIWQYRSPLPEDAPQRAPTRTLALYGDKVFLATADAALVALDARTGEEVWRTMKADYTQGFRGNAGPVIAAGVVVTGTNGCQRYVPDRPRGPVHRWRRRRGGPVRVSRDEGTRCMCSPCRTRNEVNREKGRLAGGPGSGRVRLHRRLRAGGLPRVRRARHPGRSGGERLNMTVSVQNRRPLLLVETGRCTQISSRVSRPESRGCRRTPGSPGWPSPS